MFFLFIIFSYPSVNSKINTEKHVKSLTPDTQADACFEFVAQVEKPSGCILFSLRNYLCRAYSSSLESDPEVHIVCFYFVLAVPAQVLYLRIGFYLIAILCSICIGSKKD